MSRFTPNDEINKRYYEERIENMLDDVIRDDEDEYCGKSEFTIGSSIIGDSSFLNDPQVRKDKKSATLKMSAAYIPNFPQNFLQREQMPIVEEGEHENENFRGHPNFNTQRKNAKKFKTVNYNNSPIPIHLKENVDQDFLEQFFNLELQNQNYISTTISNSSLNNGRYTYYII
jgi:hypothetical protein